MHFEFECGFMDSLDWRQREFNTAADLVADHCIACKASIDTIRAKDTHRSLSSKGSLQILVDGGFHGVDGAAGFAIVGVKTGNGEIRRTILGAEVFFSAG